MKGTIRGFLPLSLLLLLCEVSLHAQSDSPHLSISDEYYTEPGRILFIPKMDTTSPVTATYYFRVNDWSMMEPLPQGGITSITPEGHFQVYKEYPDTLEIEYYQLAGNEEKMIVWLDSIRLPDSTLVLAISDTISPSGHFMRKRFVRPDLYGRIFPNPVMSNIISVEVETDQPGELRLDFVDTSGRFITGDKYLVPDKGRNTYELDLTLDLASGSYMLVITTDFGRSYQLVSIQR